MSSFAKASKQKISQSEGLAAKSISAFVMLKYIIPCIMLFLTLPLSSQTWDSVRKSSDYLTGEGWGSSIDEADKQALASLISKIVVNVSSFTQNDEQSKVTDGNLEEISQFSSTVNTYTQATLTNTEMVIIQNEPDAHVGRWIRRSEIERIFASRIARIKDYVGSAIAAASKGKADDALRNYYWAFTMLKSVQRPNQVEYMDDNGENHMLVTWIPQQMDEIFDALKVEVVKRIGDDVELFITFHDKPVNSVDYTYFDG